VAQKVRIPYLKTVRHDLKWGGQREAIFAYDQDRWRFLEVVERKAQGCPKKGAAGLAMAKADDET
jgi:hypothetical protein